MVLIRNLQIVNCKLWHARIKAHCGIIPWKFRLCIMLQQYQIMAHVSHNIAVNYIGLYVAWKKKGYCCVYSKKFRELDHFSKY